MAEDFLVSPIKKKSNASDNRWRFLFPNPVLFWVVFLAESELSLNDLVAQICPDEVSGNVCWLDVQMELIRTLQANLSVPELVTECIMVNTDNDCPDYFADPFVASIHLLLINSQ